MVTLGYLSIVHLIACTGIAVIILNTCVVMILSIIIIVVF